MSDATHVVDAITSEGVALERVLMEAGVVTGDAWSEAWSLDTKVLRRLFHDLCVVMKGHLPGEYWPKYRKASQEPREITLCTCPEFAQHAECEHQVFVLGMLARPGESPNLANTPLVRKKGRKRKAGD